MSDGTWNSANVHVRIGDPSREQQILDWMQGRDWTMQIRIVTACVEDFHPNMNARTARKNLAALVDEGRLEIRTEGEGNRVYYRLPRPPEPEPAEEAPAEPPKKRKSRRRRE